MVLSCLGPSSPSHHLFLLTSPQNTAMSKEKDHYKLQKDLLPSSPSLPPRAWPKRTSLVLELSSRWDPIPGPLSNVHRPPTRLSVRTQLLLPPDLDRTEVTKYPLVVLLPNQPNAHQVGRFLKNPKYPHEPNLLDVKVVGLQVREAKSILALLQ